MSSWKYYNHAAVSACAPHVDPDMTPIENGDIWTLNGSTPLLARWTTDFDKEKESGWWYVIKDQPFDISTLKAKRRYEINKGNKNFIVKTIDPAEYSKELGEVQKAAFSAYPSKYRPVFDEKRFRAGIEKLRKYTVYGAFFTKSERLCGYAWYRKEEGYINLAVLKTDPEYEKYGLNAAIVHKILIDEEEFLKSGGYICDGQRSINHETAFQDYLEKYFGFRKAFCNLHIAYNPKIKWIIKVLFPLRKILRLFDGIGIVHSVNSVLKMEEIVRNKEG